MRRRDFVMGALALGALPSAPARAAIPPSPGLAALARRTGRYFGCAVKSRQLREDPDFTAAVARECDIVVQEYELKRGTTERKQGRYDFSGTDAIMAFARKHDIAGRGHPLVWYAANPDWLDPALHAAKPGPREKLMTDYIRTAMRRYAGWITEWDVVNEAIEPNDGRPDGMRADSMWLRTMGEGYIDTAFHTAREVGPKASLFLTDFGLEHDSTRCERRRTAFLKLLDRLMARGVPVDAVGIQGHLKPYKEGFSQKVFADFLDKITGYGLDISVTEFDLADRGGPPDPDKRDRELAAVAKAFLDVTLDNPATRGVVCWGLSDRYSWLSNYPDYKWPDGQLSRGLPLDAAGERKPLWSAIADAFRAAPQMRERSA